VDTLGDYLSPILELDHSDLLCRSFRTKFTFPMYWNGNKICLKIKGFLHHSDLLCRCFRTKFTFPMYSNGNKICFKIKGFLQQDPLNMANDYPYWDICTKSTIWPWPISQGHSSHFNCNIVKTQNPDKFTLMSGAVVFRTLLSTY